MAAILQGDKVTRWQCDKVTREARAMAARLQATINVDCQFRLGLNHWSVSLVYGIKFLLLCLQGFFVHLGPSASLETRRRAERAAAHTWGKH